MSQQTNLATKPVFRPATPVEEPRGDTQSLHSVRPERRAALAARRAGWLFVFVLVVGLFGMAGFHAMIVQQQRQVDGLNAELAEVQARNDELKVQLTQLEAPDRVLTIARQDLGMVYVEPSQVTWLDAPAGQLSDSIIDQALVTAQQ